MLRESNLSPAKRGDVKFHSKETQLRPRCRNSLWWLSWIADVNSQIESNEFMGAKPELMDFFSDECIPANKSTGTRTQLMSRSRRATFRWPWRCPISWIGDDSGGKKGSWKIDFKLKPLQGWLGGCCNSGNLLLKPSTISSTQKLQDVKVFSLEANDF